MKKILFFLLVLGFLLVNINGVFATNGCRSSDPICGPAPTDNCDVRANTIFNPGTYNLPNGIDICANNIILDCDGALLSGSASNKQLLGIYLESLQGITIRNCNVQGYFSGFSLNSPSYSNFTSNTAYNNSYVGFASAGTQNTFTSNTAYNNFYDGFFSSQGTQNTFTSNTAYANSNGGGISLEDGYGNTVANNLAYDNDFGFRIFGSSNTIRNNTAYNNIAHGFEAGNNNTLTNNTAHNNGYNGFYSFGNQNTFTSNTANYNNNTGFVIGLVGLASSYNDLASNTAKNNLNGFQLIGGSDNLLINNLADNNSYAGFAILSSSKSNNLDSNIASNTGANGFYVYDSSNNSFTSNIAEDNRNGFQLWYSSNNSFTSNIAEDSSFVGFSLTHYSNSNTFYNNTARNDGFGFSLGYATFSNNFLLNKAENNGQGFSLGDAQYNNITDNLINNNDYGVTLGGSRGGFDTSFNIIKSNIITNNSVYGIFLGTWGLKNLIYNNFFNNTINVLDTERNSWNITKTTGTNIIGGPFLGGNFWSDYNGMDVNGDGLGDTMLPYNSNGNILGGDYLPLTTPQMLIKTHVTRNSCTQLPSNALSWWPGDGNTNDIILGNNLTLLNGAGFAQGKVNMAFGFDGIDDFATTSGNVLITGSRITIDAWVFPNNVQGAFQKIFKVHTADYRDVWMGITNTGELEFYIYDINGAAHGITAPISANRWHHVAGTYDGSVQKLYIDGVRVRSSSWSGNFLFNDILYMGRDNIPGHPYNGKIDEADIFNRALSEAEIQAIFNAGSNGKCRP